MDWSYDTETVQPSLKRRRSSSVSSYDFPTYETGIFDMNTTSGASPFIYASSPDESCDEYDFEPESQQDAIVVSVGGACRSNDGVSAEASYGLFFHQDSSMNRAECLPSHDISVHTHQRAELMAALKGLEAGISITGFNPRGRKRVHLPPSAWRKLRRVVIKSESAYVVNGMTDNIYTSWDERTNSFTTCRVGDVANADLFQRLDEAVMQLSDQGVAVQFWQVSSGENEVAGWLARAAFDGLTAANAVDEFFSGY